MIVEVVEPQPACHDIACDVGHGTTAAERVRAEPQQGVGNGDAQLHGHHAGRLMDDEPEVAARLELGSERPGAAPACMREDGAGRDVGHDQGVGVLVVGERAGPVAIQVQRTDVDVADRRPGTRTPLGRRRRQRERANSDQRIVAGWARSGSMTGVCWRWASMHGPSPSVYCSSSIRVLTSFVVHTEPLGLIS